ncbi:Bacteriophage capsid protein-like protein [Chthoniobacter flavus Ellin428]|uniref:Bacteriophage capsid protein-like protein n=1 Tax=Chthoniobacter flavus Ellin428 TaxID=497964 RepID=B4CWU6_9BACT|nr:phage portal protein [Chthoniobacter flavus]EDY21266.1 Bacteriophage capsid protein-like protein [Chthoniobacter flavus Ellin428]TCO87633.1 lambda family portal protein [Chthoniobacter flavus]
MSDTPTYQHSAGYYAKLYDVAERTIYRWITVSEIYGVGAGLFPNAATTDAAFNEVNTLLFDQWGNTAFCSSSNHYNLWEMQKLIVRELLIAGEVFIVLIKSPSGYPQLMLVPTENVKHSGDENDDSIEGLYVDAFGKVIAYNIYTGSSYQKIEAGSVIHLMRHKQIGQLRGIGSFAASLNSMRDVKDLLALEKKAVKVHSTLAAVVERKAGEAGEQGMFGDMMPITTTGEAATAPTNIGLEKAFPGAVAWRI